MPIPINPAAHPALSTASKWLPACGRAVCHQAADWTLSPRASRAKPHSVCQAGEVLEVLGLSSSVATLTPFGWMSSCVARHQASVLRYVQYAEQTPPFCFNEVNASAAVCIMCEECIIVVHCWWNVEYKYHFHHILSDCFCAHLYHFPLRLSKTRCF